MQFFKERPFNFFKPAKTLNCCITPPCIEWRKFNPETPRCELQTTQKAVYCAVFIFSEKCS